MTITVPVLSPSPPNKRGGSEFRSRLPIRPFGICDAQSRAPGPAGTVILVVSVIENTKAALPVEQERATSLMASIIRQEVNSRNPGHAVRD
jgi:hypothetical protein